MVVFPGRRLAAGPEGKYAAAVFQHFGLAAVTLTIPRLVAQASGADAITVENYVQVAMIALGLATLLQAWGWRGIGSGYLLPACFSGIYVAPALAVATSHGLGAVAGLTVVAGLTQIVLSWFLRFFRSFIPPDVVGVGIFMIGLGWGTLGLKLLFGISIGQTSAEFEWVAGAIALASMVAASVWGSNSVRPAAVLIGLSAGCLVTALMFLAVREQALILPDQFIIAPRWPLFELTFGDSYLPGFMIGAVVSFLRVMGDVIASHQVSDLNWKRPNTRTVAAGGFAEGLGNILGGLIGSMPVNTSSGSVGLVAASGVSSRTIAWGAGVLWIVVALLPFGVSVLLLIPETVQGAAVFFTAGFVMRSGFIMLTQRMIDSRRAITVGSALIVGLSFEDIMHALALSPQIKTVFTSALLASVSAAILLTALFRIGIKRRVATKWTADQGDAPLKDWILTHGRLWVARTSLVERAESVLEEFALAAPHLTDGPVSILAHYDEISLKLEMTWQGKAFLAGYSGNTIPNLEDETRGVHLKLSMALIRRISDHMAEKGLPRGHQRLTISLDDL